LHHFARHVGQAKIATLVAVGQSLVVDAQQNEEKGVYNFLA
jgi:hypothetical protein